jgi:thioredoxin
VASASSKKKTPKKRKKSSWLSSRTRTGPGGTALVSGKVARATDKTFRELVLQTDLPVLVDFWAGWCSDCRQMTPILEELASQYAGMAWVVRIDIEKHPKTPALYGVDTLPTVLVFKNGEIIQTFIGASSKGELSKVLAWAMRQQ